MASGEVPRAMRARAPHPSSEGLRTAVAGTLKADTLLETAIAREVRQKEQITDLCVRLQEICNRLGVYPSMDPQPSSADTPSGLIHQLGDVQISVGVVIGDLERYVDALGQL